MTRGNLSGTLLPMPPARLMLHLAETAVWQWRLLPSIMMARNFIFSRITVAGFNSTRFRHNSTCQLPAQNIRYMMELTGRGIWCLTPTVPRHSQLTPAQILSMNIPYLRPLTLALWSLPSKKRCRMGKARTCGLRLSTSAAMAQNYFT